MNTSTPNSNNSPPIRSDFSKRFDFLQSRRREEQLAKKRPPNWWTPVWRGLIADPESKHRKVMGSAVWVYLYLLTYANRKTGIVRRTQQMMVKDTGYSLGTVQAGLRRLRKAGYLTTKRIGRYLEIQINKWKGFTVKKQIESVYSKRP